MLWPSRSMSPRYILANHLPSYSEEELHLTCYCTHLLYFLNSLNLSDWGSYPVSPLTFSLPKVTQDLNSKERWLFICAYPLQLFQSIRAVLFSLPLVWLTTPLNQIHRPGHFLLLPQGKPKFLSLALQDLHILVWGSSPCSSPISLLPTFLLSSYTGF